MLLPTQWLAPRNCPPLSLRSFSSFSPHTAKMGGISLRERPVDLSLSCKVVKAVTGLEHCQGFLDQTAVFFKETVQPSSNTE